VSPAGAGVKRSRGGPPSPDKGPHASLAEQFSLLTQALIDQTAALNRMAESNEQLVQALIEAGDEPDPLAEPSHYLSGKPINPV
jgi:hypothetical protein